MNIMLASVTSTPPTAAKDLKEDSSLLAASFSLSFVLEVQKAVCLRFADRTDLGSFINSKIDLATQMPFAACRIKNEGISRVGQYCGEQSLWLRKNAFASR